MKTLSALQVAWLGFAIAGITACGGSKPATGAVASPTPTPTTTAQPAQPPPTFTPAPTVPPVPFEELIALLPDADGWTRSKPRGDQYVMAVLMSRAQVTYTKGEAEIDLEIVDTGFNELALAPLLTFLTPGYSERTIGGYKKGLIVAGAPGFESYENDARRAEVTVVAGKRFIVKATGHNMDNTDATRALVSRVDIGRLK